VRCVSTRLNSAMREHARERVRARALALARALA
jgi:hypothetical protein